MKVSLQQLDHLAHLARLPLTSEERERFAGQLSQALDFVGQLSLVKSKRVQVTTTVTGLTNVFREDREDQENCLSQSQALANAPSVKEGYFKTRAVLRFLR